MKDEIVEKILKLLIEEKSIIKVLTTLEKDEYCSNHSGSNESVFEGRLRSISDIKEIVTWVN